MHPYEIHVKHESRQISKSHLPIIYYSVPQSFWSFAQYNANYHFVTSNWCNHIKTICAHYASKRLLTMNTFSENHRTYDAIIMSVYVHITSQICYISVERKPWMVNFNNGCVPQDVDGDRYAADPLCLAYHGGPTMQCTFLQKNLISLACGIFCFQVSDVCLDVIH